MSRDGTDNDRFGNLFRRSLLSIENDLPDACRRSLLSIENDLPDACRRSLLSIENDLPDAFRNVFNNLNELRNVLKTENESEVKSHVNKKETAKKEKMIIIEGEIIS